MPLSRLLLAACLKALAGLGGLVALLVLAVVVQRLIREGWTQDLLPAVVFGAAIAAGALACRWAARRIVP